MKNFYYKNVIIYQQNRIDVDFVGSCFVFSATGNSQGCSISFCRGADEDIDVSNQFVYTINMIYEWDENKRIKNIEKHGYDLADGQLVYESPNKITIESHRPHERRWLDIAEVGRELVTLTFAYTLRRDAVRFFSLRKASRKERNLFHEQNNQENVKRNRCDAF